MSPFGIFTIVLIILYVMYYAILISRDLYSKKTSIKSGEEEFDVFSLQEEETAIDVEESENGFLLNPLQTNGKATTSIDVVTPGTATRDGVDNGGGTAASGTVPDGTAPSVPFTPPGVTNSSETTPSSGGGTSATQTKIDKVQEEMDEIDPIGNLTMSKEFFRDLLLQANKEGSLFIQKKHVSAV